MNPQGGYAGGRGMNLPPSGPMAMSAGWYNRQAGPSGPANAPQDPDGLVGHDPAAGDGSGPNEGPDGQSGSDPLSNMEPLRQTLPDVGGAATSAAGEN